MAKPTIKSAQTWKQLLAVLLLGAAMVNLLTIWSSWADIQALDSKAAEQREALYAVQDRGPEQQEHVSLTISVAKLMHNLSGEKYYQLALSLLAVIASLVLWKDAGGKWRKSNSVTATR